MSAKVFVHTKKGNDLEKARTTWNKLEQPKKKLEQTKNRQEQPENRLEHPNQQKNKSCNASVWKKCVYYRIFLWRHIRTPDCEDSLRLQQH